MRTGHVGWRRPALALAGAALLVALAAAAHGRVDVFVGGAIGVPLYPYPPPPPYVVAPYPAPWVYENPAPPPGWVPGHWDREYDRTGRSYRVWVPGHLR